VQVVQNGHDRRVRQRPPRPQLGDNVTHELRCVGASQQFHDRGFEVAERPESARFTQRGHPSRRHDSGTPITTDCTVAAFKDV
jgi:hypothetical protein